MEDLTIYEKIYIQQALYYLKFKSMDDDDKPRELAGSSFANSIFDKIYEDIKNNYAKHGKDFPKHPPFSKENHMPAIINFMKNIEARNWAQLSDQHKISAIRERLYPLQYTDELIEEILAITENHYKGGNPAD